MRILVTRSVFVVALALPASAQRHEVGLMLGRIQGTERSTPAGRLNLGGGVALQANYGYLLVRGRWGRLYGEVHLLANPLREIAGSIPSSSRDVATIFVTPGVRAEFLPRAAVSPYLVGGGGYAAFEHSLLTRDGQPNPASRVTQHGTFTYGGGVDIRFWRWLGWRAEVRDFYSGSPSFNTPVRGQHNLVAGGGFVVKFGSSE